MVVALGATDRQPHERGRNDLERVGDHLVAGGGLIHAGRGGAVRGGTQEAGGGELLDVFGAEVPVRLRHHLVAGQLLLNEAVERLVGVERADDVVAVLVGVGPDRVLAGVAFGVGVAGHVEPVSAPALAVARRVEQPVDQALVGVGPCVGEEGAHLVRRRRQSGEVERRPADEGAPVGRDGERQAVRPQLLQQEGVDGISDLRRRIGNPRRGGPAHRLEGPEGTLLGRDEVAGDLLRLGAGRLRTAGDPAREDGLLLRRELLLARRHFLRDDALNQQAVVGLSGDDRRPRIAALNDEAPQPQVEFAAQLVGLAVALEAVRLEDRAGVFLESECRVRGRRGANGGAGQQHGQHGQPGMMLHGGTTGRSGARSGGRCGGKDRVKIIAPQGRRGKSRRASM